MTKISPIATANRACTLLYSYISQYSKGTYLLPVNVCPDVPLTFCLANVSFEFVDIDEKTLCINKSACLNKIRKNIDKYQGIVFVRTYGFLDNASGFFDTLHSESPDLRIIDDRCLCIPDINADMQGADMLLYSTGHCKQIDLGKGGLAVFRNVGSYKIEKNVLYDGTDEVAIYKEAFSSNKPFDRIPSGWLCLDYLDISLDTYLSQIENYSIERNLCRDKLNEIYKTHLPESIQLPNEYQNWRFNISVDFSLKDVILKKIFESNLFASSHYNSANRLFNYDIYSNSERLHSRVINLFNDKYYSEDKALRTCEIINNIINEYSF